MIILTQDRSGNLPDPSVAARYADAIGSPTFPVTADPLAAVVDDSPWDGSVLPGKCVLSPEMVMLDCYTGDDDAAALDLIAADFAAHPTP